MGRASDGRPAGAAASWRPAWPLSSERHDRRGRGPPPGDGGDGTGCVRGGAASFGVGGWRKARRSVTLRRALPLCGQPVHPACAVSGAASLSGQPARLTPAKLRGQPARLTPANPRGRPVRSGGGGDSVGWAGGDRRVAAEVGGQRVDVEAGGGGAAGAAG